MYAGADLFQCLQQLLQHAAWQSNKLNQLESMIQGLETEIASLKGKPHTNIEKIEYTFDQLKVEKLEGTLNIGITPGGVGSIEEFAVNQHHDSVASVQNEITQFLNTTAPKEIARMEKQFHLTLGESYHRKMIEDIHKQVHQRIQVYAEKARQEGRGGEGPTDLLAAEKLLIDKVKRDIIQGFYNHIENLTRKEGQSDEFSGDQ